jgi:hypothetical protein
VKELNSFEREYFLQTRKEIDDEKHSRDTILNIAVAVLGGLGFALLNERKDQAVGDLIQTTPATLLTISGLVIVTALMWARKMKLRQIADRWFVLRSLLIDKSTPQTNTQLLEEIACDGLTGWRYIRKDFVFVLAISTPFYVILVMNGVLGMFIVGAHLCLAICIFLRRFLDSTERNAPREQHIIAWLIRRLRERP